MGMLTQALTIMSVGMGLVFVFLALMIGGMAVSARLIRGYEARQAGRSAPGATGDGQRLAAVIAVALSEHEARS